MNLSKGRKSTNILDRRTSNKSAFISDGGNRYADEQDMVSSVIPEKLPKNPDTTKLGASVDLYVKNLGKKKAKPKAKVKPNPKVLDKYKKI